MARCISVLRTEIPGCAVRGFCRVGNEQNLVKQCILSLHTKGLAASLTLRLPARHAWLRNRGAPHKPHQMHLGWAHMCQKGIRLLDSCCYGSCCAQWDWKKTVAVNSNRQMYKCYRKHRQLLLTAFFQTREHLKNVLALNKYWARSGDVMTAHGALSEMFNNMLSLMVLHHDI